LADDCDYSNSNAFDASEADGLVSDRLVDSAPTASEASPFSSAEPSAYVESSPSIFEPSPLIKCGLSRVSPAISTCPMGCQTRLFAASDIYSEIDGARNTQDNAIAGLGLYRYNIGMDCRFRSIGAHLQGQHIHLKLREAASSWISENEETLQGQNLLEDDGEIDRRYQKSRRLTWACSYHS